MTCREMPVALYGYTAIEFNGKIYVGGGCRAFGRGEGDYSKHFYCYDPTDDLWSVKARNGKMATIGLPLFAKTNEFLYAIEGHGTIHQYDPIQDIWTLVIEIQIHHIYFEIHTEYVRFSDWKLRRLWMHQCHYKPQ